MATTSTRTTTIQYEGDVTAVIQKDDAANGNSPGAITILSIGPGSTTVTVPTGGSSPVAVTIVPPTGNTHEIVLKGSSGDDGIKIHPSNPMTLSLDPTVETFVLTAFDTILGLQLMWT